jgi:hypothetical protein
MAKKLRPRTVSWAAEAMLPASAVVELIALPSSGRTFAVVVCRIDRSASRAGAGGAPQPGNRHQDILEHLPRHPRGRRARSPDRGRARRRTNRWSLLCPGRPAQATTPCGVCTTAAREPCPCGTEKRIPPVLVIRELQTISSVSGKCRLTCRKKFRLRGLARRIALFRELAP